MIRVVLCDDEGERLEEKKEILKFCEQEFPIKWDIFSFEKLKVDEFLKSARIFSVFFIQVDMKNVNGIELAKSIRRLNKSALIILMTENLDNMLNALDAVVFNLLLEPISKKEFYQMLEKAIHFLGEIEPPFSCRSFHDEILIKQEHILFFEKEKRRVRIHTIFGTEVCYMTTREILEQINLKLFCRCHQSYIVNFNYVGKIKTDSLELINGVEVDISRTYKHDFRNEYFQYISRKS